MLTAPLGLTSRLLETYGASVAGVAHAREFRNNQDAWTTTPPALPFVATVTDGVSQGRWSEVGAQMGGRIVNNTILEYARLAEEDETWLDTAESWHMCQEEIVERLGKVARLIGDPLEQTIYNYFAFSTIGVVILPHKTHFFSYGDGLWVVNGKPQKIGPWPGNAPPCLAYAVLNPEWLKQPFQRVSIPTCELEHCVVGSDGALDFLKHPGLRRRNRIEELWTNDEFFKDPSPGSAWLAELNKEPERFTAGNHERFGYFEDDTTVVVVRASQPATQSQSAATTEEGA